MKIRARLKGKLELSASLKNKFVYRFFWGRGNLYKNVLHLSIIGVSLLVLVTGLTSDLFKQKTVSNLSAFANNSSGDVDLLEQGGSIQSVQTSDNIFNFTVAQYKVKSGDTVQKISKKFGVSTDTIKWANKSIDYYKENIKAGDTILIPEINGVLYQVKKGDTLPSVLKKVRGADKTKTIGINNLIGPNYKLATGTKILIPDAKLPTPVRSVQSVRTFNVSYASDPYSGGALTTGVIVSTLKGLHFSDPLSHPACRGYVWIRGFNLNPGPYYHNGVDLAKRGGCPERATEAGVITYAGWSSTGEGYMVKVNHGNGVESLYFHGNGQIYVQVGQRVKKGQDLQYMGCTGYCTGTHLHYSLRINGQWIDPAPYVPYRR